MGEVFGAAHVAVYVVAVAVLRVSEPMNIGTNVT